MQAFEWYSEGGGVHWGKLSDVRRESRVLIINANQPFTLATSRGRVISRSGG